MEIRYRIYRPCELIVSRIVLLVSMVKIVEYFRYKYSYVHSTSDVKITARFIVQACS